jgi:hypothetical protein
VVAALCLDGRAPLNVISLKFRASCGKVGGGAGGCDLDTHTIYERGSLSHLVLF